MLNIPKLPEKEELEYKEKSFFLSLAEQIQSSSKIWFYLLGAVAVIAVPSAFFLRSVLTKTLINRLPVLPVNLKPYEAMDLKIARTGFLELPDNTYSLFAQVLNVNSDIASKEFNYAFVLRDGENKVLRRLPGTNYLSAGESKFLIVPSVRMDIAPAKTDLELSEVRWTKFQPHFTAKFEIIQQNSGVTPEGQFFAEGLARNVQGFRVNEVEVQAIAFDSKNEKIVAVNSTRLTDLEPFESRYFRLLWPKAFSGIGYVQIEASVNPFSPGLTLPEVEPLPPR